MVKIHRILWLTYIVVAGTITFRNAWPYRRDLIALFAFLSIGAATGYGISGFGRRAPFLQAAAGAFAAVVIWSFSTSVWAYRAAAERVPGIPSDTIWLLSCGTIPSPAPSLQARPPRRSRARFITIALQIESPIPTRARQQAVDPASLDHSSLRRDSNGARSPALETAAARYPEK